MSDPTALELRKSPADLEHQLAGRSGRVDCLLIEVQVDVAGLQGLDRAKQIDQRAAHAVDRPRHDDVKPTPLGVLEHGIEPRPLIAPLSPANASVAVFLDKLPTAAFGNRRPIN
jgi:hypothetical protein